MKPHNKRLRNGVKELIQTDETTLEDLHMIATDVISRLDKLAARSLRKLKCGQGIRVYNEESNKEYGQRGADIICFYLNSYDTKTKGAVLRVYDAKREWTVTLDCLLDISEEFDPESEEGKKKAQKAGARKKGRKAKKQEEAADYSPKQGLDEPWNASDAMSSYEPERAGEEYDFSASTDWSEYYDKE